MSSRQRTANCLRPEYRRGKKGRLRRALATSAGILAVGALALQAQTDGLIARTQIVGGTVANPCPVLLVNFTQDLTLADQSVADGGQSLTIRLQSAGNVPQTGVAADLIETQPGLDVPGFGTVSVTLDASGPQPVLRVRLPNEATKAVVTQSGARSILIALEPTTGACPAPQAEQTPTEQADAPAPESDVPPEPETAALDQPEALLAEARAAIVATDYDHAVQLLTKLLELPQNAASADAQELLGVVRERNGQLAHAKAEYEIYLQAYPDGPGADRVRQRLLAIETAESTLPEPLRAADAELTPPTTPDGAAAETPHITSIPRRNESFPPLLQQPGVSGGGGSIAASADVAAGGTAAQAALEDPFEATISATYYLNQSSTLITELTSHTTDSDTELLQNTVVLSFDLSDEFLRGGQTYSYRFSGEYEQDLAHASNSGLNLSRVYGELQFGQEGAAVSLGRQSWNDDVTLGRYDGIRLSYPVGDGLRLSGVAGLSVGSTSDTMFSGNAMVFGLVGELTGLGENKELTVYSIGEFDQSFTERLVVGAEGSYSNDTTTTYGLIEYDMAFAALNTARISWSHIYQDRSSASITVDYSHSPSLGLSSALTGQTVATLQALSAFYTTAEMQDLAMDRTSQILSLSGSWQKPINDTWQFSFDGTLYNTSGMPASGGVAAVPALGWDYYTSAQIIGTGIFTEDDAVSLSGRFADDSASQLVMLDGYWSYGVTDKLNLKPRLQVAHRVFADGGGTEDFAIPSISMDYEINDGASLNLEVGTRLSTSDTPSFLEETNAPYIVAGFTQTF